MLDVEWTETVDELEAVCEAWRLVAAGDTDIETVALPEIPSATPPDRLLPRLVAIQSDLEAVRSELAGALGKTEMAISELHVTRQAASHYLRHGGTPGALEVR